MNSAKELIDEHAVIMKVVTSLKWQAAALSSGKPVPEEQLTETLALLVEFADKCHHAKEEKILFPALAMMPQHRATVAEFLDEHARSRANVRAMRACPAAATDEVARKAFVENANSYVSILVKHIQKENVLFSKCGEIFSAAENERMAEEYERIEKEEIGEGKHEEYHSRAEKLAAEARFLWR